MNCKKLILALGLITLSRQGNPNTVSQQPINNQPLYQPPMMGGGPMIPNGIGVGYYGGMFNPYMGGYWNWWNDWDDYDGGRRRRRRHSRKHSRSKSKSSRS